MALAPEQLFSADDQYRIASNQFGYLMYACENGEWSDAEADAALYGPFDNRDIKLPFWRGVAKVNGLDPSKVQIIEA